MTRATRHTVDMYATRSGSQDVTEQSLTESAESADHACFLLMVDLRMVDEQSSSRSFQGMVTRSGVAASLVSTTMHFWPLPYSAYTPMQPILSR